MGSQVEDSRYSRDQKQEVELLVSGGTKGIGV